MPATYQTLLTNYGQAALATAISNGTAVNIATLVVGDGGGSATTPSASQTALVNQVYSVAINSVTVDPSNPNYVVAEATIPSNVGGWTIREAGLKDASGNLFAVANYADTIKPVVASGTAADLVIRFIFQVSNTAAVTLLIDPAVVMASQSWVLSQAYVKRDGSLAMTGPLTLLGDPTLANHAASKNYVDSRSGVDSVPIGSVFWTAMNTAPAGSLVCDGSAVSRTTYSALFSKIGTVYGSGDGSTTFNLPDLRGQFVRGWDNGRGKDISVFTGNQTNLSTTISGLSSTATMYVGQPVSGTNIPNGTTIASITNSTTIVLSAAATATITGNSLTFTGRAFASAQSDDFKSHAHRFATIANIVNGASPTTATLADWEAGGATQGPGNVEPLGGAETRPTNVAMLPCIKAYLLSNVDIALINSAITLYVAKAGDTMTGPLVLSGAPTLNLHAATKSYVDGLIATCQAALGFTPVNRAGDTMTGLLTLSGMPTATMHAAPKQYVDTAVTSAVPAGTVIYVAMASAPSGYLKANGAAVSRTTYAVLFAAIGTTFGSGDGSTTFNLPDLRSEFIRGLDDGRGVDTGRALGSSQADELKSHTHTYLTRAYTAVQSGSNLACWVGDATANTGATGGTETRPRNVALLAVIKF
jgi:phage-related tail fiber protein